MKLMKAGIAASVATVLASSVVNGAIIVDFQSVTPLGGGLYQWTYTADLQPDANMRVTATPPPGAGLLPHDAFTIYDVGGLVPGSAVFTPAIARTFLTTSQPIGLTPPLVTPDDSALLNVTVQLTAGGDIIPTPAGSSVLLGTLTFNSIFSGDDAVFTHFTGQTQKKSNLTTLSNIGFVLVPAVPEPAALTLPAATLLLLSRRRR